LDNPTGRITIPFTSGVELRVVLGGLISGSVRSAIETPLEYAKIQRQMGKSWKLKDTYTGFKVTWLRASGLLMTYFVLLDSCRRNFDSAFRNSMIGPFVSSGLSSVVAWWAVWPLECIKSQTQANANEKLSIIQRIRITTRERGGFFALYRGLGPGILRNFLGSGFAMLTLLYANRKISELGLRG
jgi:solute carrier family 25 (mitochondrial carnitine/acylcarnitine transporter), member 20/29